MSNPGEPLSEEMQAMLQYIADKVQVETINEAFGNNVPREEAMEILIHIANGAAKYYRTQFEDTNPWGSAYQLHKLLIAAARTLGMLPIHADEWVQVIRKMQEREDNAA